MTTGLTVLGSGLKVPAIQSRIVVIVWIGYLAKITGYTLKLVLRRFFGLKVQAFRLIKDEI